MNPNNPNDNQDQPQPINPIPQPSPQPEPLAGPSPAEQPQPATTPSPVAEPVAPAPQPQPQAAGAATPMPEQPSQKGKKNKLPGLIAIVVGVLLLVGGGVWAAVHFLGGGVPLEEYQGEGYSVSVPKEYEREDLGQAVNFNGPGDDVATQSRVTVSASPTGPILTAISREELIAQYDTTYSEDSITESLTGEDEQGREITTRNFSKSDDDHNGIEARRVSFEMYAGDEHIGTVSTLVVFGEDTIYTVNILAHQDQPGLQKSSGKILSSLKIGE